MQDRGRASSSRPCVCRRRDDADTPPRSVRHPLPVETLAARKACAPRSSLHQPRGARTFIGGAGLSSRHPLSPPCGPPRPPPVSRPSTCYRPEPSRRFTPCVLHFTRPSCAATFPSWHVRQDHERRAASLGERPFPGPGVLGPCGMWERGRLPLTHPLERRQNSPAPPTEADISEGGPFVLFSPEGVWG